jgi:hypothetical protein
VRTPHLIAAACLAVLTACQQTTTAPVADSTATANTGAAPPASSQLMTGAQQYLNRYGFGDVDANTLTRDQIIRINRIDTFRQRAPQIRREISAILARSQ